MIVTKLDGHAFAPDYVATLMGVTSRGLPAAKAALIGRRGRWPLTGALEREGRELYLGISIEGTDVDALYAQLCQWMDPESEIVKKLTVTDDDGSDERYVEAKCEGLQQQEEGIQTIYVATLAVHDDVRWRAETPSTHTWAITGSGQTGTIVNSGTELAFPTFKITAAAKTGGFAYKSWVPIKWLAINPSNGRYHFVATFATNALVAAGHMQADGDDLRVYVDGYEVDRWLDAMNTAATKVWFNTTMAVGQSFTLKTYIVDAGNIAQIDSNEDISKFPNSGILLIGTEAFVYTSKDITRKLFLGITRGAKGTTLAAHNVGTAGYWIQHDCWLLYGNVNLAAPTADDDYKPSFELDHSTNGSWVYETFGTLTCKGVSRWNPNCATYVAPIGPSTTNALGTYSKTQRDMESPGVPYTVMGSWNAWAAYGGMVGWELRNPCGITNVAWTNGLKRRAATSFQAEVYFHPRGTYSWYVQYVIPTPTVVNTWEAWNSATTPGSYISDCIGFYLYYYQSDLEVGDVTVTINAAEAPVVTVYAEQATYTMAATLTNVTTGEAIGVAFELEVGETLEIDTWAKNVTYLKDGSSQFQAVTPLGTVRQDWLALARGTNVLMLEDAGIAGGTITGGTIVTSFRQRYY